MEWNKKKKKRMIQNAKNKTNFNQFRITYQNNYVFIFVCVLPTGRPIFNIRPQNVKPSNNVKHKFASCIARNSTN